MIDLGRLRLSAQRAFLERITPCMRLIKVEVIDGDIVLSCLTDQVPNATVKELISDAGAEIISDFPHANIIEIIEQQQGKLPLEDVISHGWIYARYEVV